MPRFACLLGFLLASAPMISAQTPALYGSDSQLVSTGTVNRDTGSWTTIGAQTVSSITGCAWDANTQTLYGVSGFEERIFVIDTTTGVATGVGSQGAFGIPGSNVTSLAYDPNSDTLYGVDFTSNNLITIDTSSGLATIIGPITGASDIHGLAYDPENDLLYGLEDSFSNEQVHTIDTGTAVATALPNPIGSPGDWRGLTYDRERELLYATRVGGFGGGRFHSIDPQTGSQTFIGVSSDFVQGLASTTLPGPGGPTLSVQNLTGGQQASFQVDGANPGDLVVYAYSLSGSGPTTVKGVTLDLSPPIVQLGTALANAGGTAVIQRNIPGNASGRNVWLQAAVRQSGAFVTTNGLAEVVN